MEISTVKSDKEEMVINKSSSDTDYDEYYEDENVIYEDVAKSTRVIRSRAWNPSLTYNAIIKNRQKLYN